MSDPIVIIGAGGFGREVLDVIDAMNAAGTGDWDFLGFVDDGQPDPEILERLGERHLGGREQLGSLGKGIHFVVAVSHVPARRGLSQAAMGAGLRPALLIHPTATLGRDVRAEAGTIICAGARLTSNIRVGRHCHVHVNVTVGHDSRMGDFAAANPMSAVSGAVTLGSGVMLGTGSAILQGLSVGDDAVVGAGAVVVKDVPAGVTVLGVPAKVRG